MEAGGRGAGAVLLGASAVKVAIVHYWLLANRGGEKVVDALAESFPQADVFTHVVDKATLSPTLRKHRILTTFISKLPFARRFYQKYLPFMPMALEQLDLSDYDLIISSESGPAKGVIPNPDALHICYCHSPMRYIWNMYPDYRRNAGFLTRLLMPWIFHRLRIWDVTTAARVDMFLANSQNVAKRIEKYYRRDSEVIFPPVDIDAFAPVSETELGDYYLMVGELVRYKRPDLAVEAFNASGRNLVVIGGGEMEAELRKLAGPTVSILGSQPFSALQHHYARCRGLIFPGEEDFGIVPLEAMASGRPVVAFGKGGALETVVNEKTGLFFYEHTVAALNEAVAACDSRNWDPEASVAQARAFSKERFKAEIEGAVARASAGRGPASVEGGTGGEGGAARGATTATAV